MNFRYYTFFLLLFPICIFSQNLTNISPNQGSQGQSLPLIISGNNMSYTGWSCTSNPAGISQFRFSQWSGTNMIYGVPTNAVGQQLYGNLIIPLFQNLGLYNLEVFDCLNSNWIMFSNSFQINSSSWDCMNGNCIDPGTGMGIYASLAACQNNCVMPTWNCDNGNCIDPGTGMGTYASLAACQNNCVMPTWDCLGGICVNPGTGMGTYASLAVCQSNCNFSSTDFIKIKNVNIYPNPSKNIFNFSFFSEINQDITIEIIDFLGKVIFVDIKKDLLGKTSITLDLSENEKGIYLVKLKTNEGMLNKRLILQ